MRRLVPSFIVDHAADGRWSGSFDGAVLLVDATGSTSLAVSMRATGTIGDEILASMLSGVFGPQVDAVYSHGGFVAGFTGDGFLAIFPGPPSESGGRAMAAASDVRRHMAEAFSDAAEALGARFEVKAALSHGPITWHIWTAAGLRQTSTYMFHGPAVEAAQRAEKVTPPGAVLLTNEFADVLGATIETEHHEDHRRHVANLLPLPSPTGGMPQEPYGDESAFYPAELQVTPLAGEYRTVVSVFVKIRELPTPGVEDSHMSTLLRLVDRYGGFVCDVSRPQATDSGCTMLILWGAPTTFEDMFERSISFLLEVRRQIGSDAVRAGATLDHLFAGFLGSAQRAAYTCVGPGVNLAARLVAANEWGNIWIDDSLADALAEEVQSRGIGTRSFRGFDDGISITALLGRGDVEIGRFFRGELVGRSREMELVSRWLTDIHTGGSGAVLVRGEAGAGKSRMLHELQGQHGVDVRWLVGHTDAITREPLNPVAYMIRRAMGLHPEDPPRVMRDRVRSRIDELVGATMDAGLGDDLADAVEPIEQLLGVGATMAMFGRLAPQLQRERMTAAVIALLSFETAYRPVIVHLEDVHWLDDATREMLEAVIDAMSDLPIAFVLTSREPFEAAWIRHELVLPPLDAAAIEEQAASLLEGGDPAPELVSLLLERSEGNPYYVEQTVLYLQGAGLLDATDRGLAPRAAAPLPTDLQTMLIARIDALTERVKVAVQTGAVLGREFDVQVLLRMLDDIAGVPEIAVAERSRIWSALSELRYSFRHALLRDAAYEMQLRSRVRELHTRAAEAIEFLAAGEPARHAGTLAHHHEHAGDLATAARWFRTAGERAARQFANLDAIASLERAIELTPAEDAPSRYEILRQLNSIHALLGHPERQANVLDAMEPLAVSLGDRREVEVQYLRAQYASSLGDYTGAMELGQRALGRADSDELGSDRAKVRLALAEVYRATGDRPRAKLLATEALTIATEADDSVAGATANDLLGGLAYDAGALSEAAKFHRRAVDLLQAEGDEVGEIRALNNLGSALWGLGDFSAAATVHRRGIARSREIGYRRSEGDNLDNLGGTFWAVGNSREAIAQYEAALDIRRRSKDAWGIGISLHNLGTAYRTMGDPEAAVACYTEGIEVDRSIGRRRGEAFSLHGLGWARYDLGELDAAREAFTEAFSIRGDLDESAHVTETLAGLGAVAFDATDHELAADHARQIVPSLDDAFLEAADEPFRTYHVTISILDVADPPRARQLRDQVAEALRGKASRISDEADRVSYVDNLLASYETMFA